MATEALLFIYDGDRLKSVLHRSFDGYPDAILSDVSALLTHTRYIDASKFTELWLKLEVLSLILFYSDDSETPHQFSNAASLIIQSTSSLLDPNDVEITGYIGYIYRIYINNSKVTIDIEKPDPWNVEPIEIIRYEKNKKHKIRTGTVRIQRVTHSEIKKYRKNTGHILDKTTLVKYIKKLAYKVAIE